MQTAFEVGVIEIAQGSGKVMQVLGVFELRSIRNLRVFEGFQDGFRGEAHDINSGVMAIKALCLLQRSLQI
ncbi:hypothetical protein D3C78_1619710 [compost metagenome]